MKRSRTYRAKGVKRVDWEEVARGRGHEGVHVGLDVGKRAFLGVVRWEEGEFERPWLVENPGEIREFVKLLRRMGRGRELTVAMEPTGTYGDPLRQTLADAGVPLERVSPKAAHDYAEVLDGVPSKHDGKDAAVGLAADRQAFSRLAGWGRCCLAKEKIRGLLQSASETVGVRQGTFEVRRMQSYASAALEARQEVARSKRRLADLARPNAVIQAQSQEVGVATACVLWVHLGDPREYSCAAAYRKAMGLNLAEHSSGQFQGRLRISKRGASEVRRWLYFAALRWVQKESVKGGNGKGKLI